MIPEKRKKVSVVVAAYNEEKYIGHTLDSILSQKVNFDYEILVGDDCSKDGTADVIRTYAEKWPDKIVPIFREKNLGMTGNALDLYMSVNGEYTALVEGDDYWIDDNKLQKQVDFLDANPDYEACFGQCIIVDEDEIRHPEMEEYSGFMKTKGDYTLKDFENYLLPGQTATMMYRSDDFKGFINKLRNSRFDLNKLIDRHMVLLMYSKGKLYNSGETTAAYRRIMKKSSGSWSSKNDYYSFDNLMTYLDGLRDYEYIAKYFGLKISFDERRKYEWDKFQDNLNLFSKKEASLVRKALIFDSNNIFAMFLYSLKNKKSK